ncbi:MAG: DUF6067 family protein, partial [Planctomycetaceae bacterium]|nr:DUF6067 family protein [Planctomycetaceae bacterium]
SGFLYAADTPKSLTIMLDGCRGDVLLMGKMPTFDSLRNGTWAENYHGAWSLTAHTIKDAGTASAANHTAIATGVTTAKTNVPGNDQFPNYHKTDASKKYPTFLTRIKTQFPKKKTAFLVQWQPDVNLVTGNNISDLFLNMSDELLAEKAVQVIKGTYSDDRWAKGTDPDAVLWYIDEPDHIGHTGGYSLPGTKHSHYVKCLETIDGWVAAALEAIKKRPNFANENWQIIVTSDHGGWVSSHGAMSAECYTIPFIVSSKTVKQGELKGQPCDADTAPTVLDHFGFDVNALKKEGVIDGSVRGKDNVIPVTQKNTDIPKDAALLQIRGGQTNLSFPALMLNQSFSFAFQVFLTEPQETNLITFGSGVRLFTKPEGQGNIIGLRLKDDKNTEIELKQIYLPPNEICFVAATIDRGGNAVLYAAGADGQLFFCSQSLIDENLGKSFGQLTGKIDTNPVGIAANSVKSVLLWERALRVEEVQKAVIHQAEIQKAALAAEPWTWFTADREHDIRSGTAAGVPNQIKNNFAGKCQPGEFYTFQIGLYSRNETFENVQMTFSDLTGDNNAKIASDALHCFNLGGISKDGQAFTKRVDIPQGLAQAFWIGVDVAENCPAGTYSGTVSVKAGNIPETKIAVKLTVSGEPIANHGDDEGWRKTRLRWLDSTIGTADVPTAPYTAIGGKGIQPLPNGGATVDAIGFDVLGRTLEITDSGLPKQIITHFDQSNQLDKNAANKILSGEVKFVIETDKGIEKLDRNNFSLKQPSAGMLWTAEYGNDNFDVRYQGSLDFDGFTEYKLTVTAKKNVTVKDIRLEIPYSQYASKYLMGLGCKGGLLPALPFDWHWDVNKHQDKLWLGNVNAGLNIKLKDENYVRPLVNVYYNLGKLKVPDSWGNGGKGGVSVTKNDDASILVKAYSGERSLEQGKTLHFDFDALITPVKPCDLARLPQERFYHPSGTGGSVAAAKKIGAKYINVHQGTEGYPFINYPYSDNSLPYLKPLIEQAHGENLGVRLYYTTRELTVNLPELWALKSLGGEVIFDGPGKDVRTLLHPRGPHTWLNENLVDHFIPAWQSRISSKYGTELDLSIITTPDSRWNNYYLGGLDWMVRNLGIDGVYIDDSALDRKTLQRARRILDQDGKRRLIDIHSWNHMNGYAGHANSLQLYLELLPYVDRLWLGEGFGAHNTLDFWMVEMSGIPFGLMSEMLDSRNQFRGMVYGMLPRPPWSGDPTGLWQLWDSFGMKDAKMLGYWDERCPVKTSDADVPVTVYVNGGKALVAIANWTDMPKSLTLTIDEKLLGFTPKKASLPQIERQQWGGDNFRLSSKFEILGRSGMILLLESCHLLIFGDGEHQYDGPLGSTLSPKSEASSELETHGGVAHPDPA